MKIAFLILAHKDPLQLHRLLRALDDPRFDFFIHIDAKSSSDFGLGELNIRHSRSHVIPRRDIQWAGWSMVEAELELMRCALSHGGYCRLVFLSGEDYPIANNNEIYRRLTESDKEFVAAEPLDSGSRCARVTEYFGRKREAELLRFPLRKILYAAGIRKPLRPVLDGRAWDIYLGSQWLGLSRACAQYILDKADSSPGLKAYFRSAHAPDEMFFHTLIMNEPEFAAGARLIDAEQNSFEQRSVLHCLQVKPASSFRRLLRYTPWRRSTVKTMTADDAAFVLSSGKLFVRKVSGEQSEELIKLLDSSRNPETH